MSWTKSAIRIEAKIVERSDGYHVLSEEGKNLGGPYASREKAEERLRDVEYFKHKGSASGTIKFTDLSEDEQDNVAVAVYNTHFLAKEKEENVPSKDEVLEWLRIEDKELKTGVAKVQDLIDQLAEENWGSHAEKSAPLLEALELGEELDPVLLNYGRLVDGAHRTLAAYEYGLETLPSIEIGPLLKEEPQLDKEAIADSLLLRKPDSEIKAKPSEFDADVGWGSSSGRTAGYDGRTVAVDFDDTIAYENPDRSIAGPVPGAKEALLALRESGHIVNIFSHRALTPYGRHEIEQWMDANGFPYNSILSGEKPGNSLFVDNEAVDFYGDWEKALRSILERDNQYGRKGAQMTWLRKVKAESVADEKRDVELAEHIEEDAEDVEQKAEDIGDKASDLAESEQKEVEELEKESDTDPGHEALEDTLTEAPSCPVCSGPGLPSGKMGRYDYFTCEGCGMEYSSLSSQ